MPSMLSNAEPSQTVQNLKHFHHLSAGGGVINWGIIAEIFFKKIEFGKFSSGITHLCSWQANHKAQSKKILGLAACWANRQQKAPCLTNPAEIVLPLRVVYSSSTFHRKHKVGNTPEMTGALIWDVRTSSESTLKRLSPLHHCVFLADSVQMWNGTR